MSALTELPFKMPSQSEMDQLFGFIEEMSKDDHLFKTAITRVLGGEEHEKVISDLLCDGDMSKVLDANIADESSEGGGLTEALKDIIVINDANNILNELKKLELSEPESTSPKPSETELIKEDSSEDESV